MASSTGLNPSSSIVESYMDSFPNLNVPGHSKGWDQGVIPPTHQRRTMVLIFDGTGDQFDDDNSNMVQLFSMLKKDDRKEQLVYYQAGIGTYTIPQIADPFRAKLSALIDSMVGKHLDVHVMGGYEFIMQNYEAGDKICIFGFSRGAYTARALAGMIYKVGLLPVCNHQQVPFAYKMYSREDKTGWKQSTAFKKAFSIDVDIEFVGVWDTVDSVGVIPRTLPFTTSNNHVRYFRHAVSLDEHRVRFTPKFWTQPTAEENELGIRKGEMPRSRPKPIRSESLKDKERQFVIEDHDADFETDVEEVWFAGCHCDVGGGSVPNGTRNSLARIPLRWMIRQCFKLNLGILFHREMFKYVGMDPSTLYPVVKPRPPLVLKFSSSSGHNLDHPPVGNLMDFTTIKDFVSEEEEDLADALSPIYDQLQLARYWWILEVIPQKVRKALNRDQSFTRKVSLNLGHGRLIPRQAEGLKFHRTVKLRLDAEGLEGGKYKPKAKYSVQPTYVD